MNTKFSEEVVKSAKMSSVAILGGGASKGKHAVLPKGKLYEPIRDEKWVEVT